MLKKFTTFKLEKQLDPQTVRQNLARRPPARPTADETVYGHAGYDQILSPVTEANTSMGALLCGAFVAQAIKIPPTLLKAEVEQETRIRLEVSGNQFLSRKEKQEILVEIKDRLRPQTQPTIQVWKWVVYGDLLFAEVTSQKQIDVFQSYMREALEQTPVHQAHRGEYRALFGPESQEGLDADALTCLLQGLSQEWFVEGPLTFAGQTSGAEIVTLAKGNPFSDPAFKSCLAKGMQLVKASLTHVQNGDQMVKGTIDARTLSLTGVKYAPVEDLDRVSRAQEQVYQMDRLFRSWAECRESVLCPLTHGTLDRESFLYRMGIEA